MCCLSVLVLSSCIEIGCDRFKGGDLRGVGAGEVCWREGGVGRFLREAAVS